MWNTEKETKNRKSSVISPPEITEWRLGDFDPWE